MGLPRISHSSDPGMIFLGAIVSEKKIVKEKFFFPFFPLNRYNTAPIGKFFFPLFPLNRYNSAPVGQILIEKIWACRARRALSNELGPVFLEAILSEKKIVKEKFFFHLFPSNRYNSAPVGQIFIEKIWACSARRALSNDPGPVFLDAILSEKKIVIEQFYLPLLPINRFNSGRIGHAILSEKKIVKEKFLFHLFPSNRYNSAPIIQILIKKIWACSARRSLSNGPVGYNSAPICQILIKKHGRVGREVPFPETPVRLFYNSVTIGQILMRKIRACRARRALSNDPSPIFLDAILSEKKVVKEKFFFPLFPLNHYNRLRFFRS
ncbi:LOW QUALITY PROTEIN: hypothetical protein V1477_017777 [Vespula maculifrons]|uniref:Maturase K n=1 Tax=Vespula maculifrons TaxID=7453 RepID=A0ABD2B1F1_VESMC